MIKRIKTKCKECKKTFIKREKDTNFYCSERCRNVFKTQIRVCLNKECAKSFCSTQRNQKLCSRSCANIYNSYEYKAQYGVEEYKHCWLKLRFEVFKRDNFTCVYCGRNVKDDNIKIHCDHVKPKSKGGTNTMDNLATSCYECNQGKFNFEL